MLPGRILAAFFINTNLNSIRSNFSMTGFYAISYYLAVRYIRQKTTVSDSLGGTLQHIILLSCSKTICSGGDEIPFT